MYHYIYIFKLYQQCIAIWCKFQICTVRTISLCGLQHYKLYYIVSLGIMLKMELSLCVEYCLNSTEIVLSNPVQYMLNYSVTQMLELIANIFDMESLGTYILE